MQKTYQMTRAAELESLANFRGLIRSACQEWPQIGNQTVYDLQLAVDEAATNIIQHGYAGMDPGSIILEMTINERKAHISLTDFGHQFEPSSAPTPDITAPLDERQAGGFGLYIIYQTMDEVDYSADACGNRLTLVKYLT